MTSSLIRMPTRRALADAGRLLREGQLVAFPTETVYGLGADATSDAAVAAIYAAKERPRFNPLIAHVASHEAAHAQGVIAGAAADLARAFWPGPLTLVVPKRPGATVSLLATAGLETVALRVPAHPVARAVLAEAGRPIAAPSANPSGRISATTAQHVAEGLGTRVAMIIDGGACPVGIESTIVGFLPEPVLLRPGAIPRDAIAAITGPLAEPSGGVQAPGQLASHYAPESPIRLEAVSVQADETLIAFGPRPPWGARHTLNLSPTASLTEAAANLFAMLHTADAFGGRIAVMPIPEDGLGEAINDRLRRAAAPRDAGP